jgi:hypothetical protein
MTKLAPIPIEGPEKATRGGGGEWEPIKIPGGNLAYILKSTQYPSLLTRPRPHRYSKAVDPQNRVRNHSGNTNRYQQGYMQSSKLLRKSLPITKFGGSRPYVLPGAEPNQRENGDLDAKQRTARNRSTKEPVGHHHSCGKEITGARKIKTKNHKLCWTESLPRSQRNSTNGTEPGARKPRDCRGNPAESGEK